jgi:hypothetical protein
MTLFDEPVFRKGTFKEALPMVLEHHYTHRRTADPMHVFVWEWRGWPVATAIFTSPANRYFGKGSIELARLVRLPAFDFPLSRFVALCLQWLKANTDLAYCLSYADTTVGHVGTIYQATNFTHVAVSKGNVQYRHRESGKIVSGRSFDQHAAGNKEDWERLRTGKKYLYVFPLKERRAKLLKRFGWEALPYPKAEGRDWLIDGREVPVYQK